MAHRRYRQEILAVFHELPVEDKRGILAIFRRYLVKRRLLVLPARERPEPGGDPSSVPAPEPKPVSRRARPPGPRSGSSRSKPRSSG